LIPRPIRSYVLRQGRFSPAQQRAHAELMPRFGIAFTPQPLDFGALFGRQAPVVVEVGSGMGETTARIAAETPGRDYLAVEVHAPASAVCSGTSESWVSPTFASCSTTRSR